MTEPEQVPKPPRCGVYPDTGRWCCRRITSAGLCERCASALGGWLADLAELIRATPAALVPGSSGDGPRVSGSREAPLPVRLAALSLLGPAAGWDRRLDAETGLDPGDDRSGVMQHGPEPVLSVLTGWCRRIASERRVTFPAPRPHVWQPIFRLPGAPYGPETAADDDYRAWLATETNAAAAAETRNLREAEALRGFLARHHDWATGQPWADEYAADVHALWRTLRTVLGRWPEKPQHCDGVSCPRCDSMALYRTSGHDGRTCDQAAGGCGKWFSDDEFDRWVRLSAHFARVEGYRERDEQTRTRLDGVYRGWLEAEGVTGHQAPCRWNCSRCLHAVAYVVLAQVLRRGGEA